MTRIHSVDLLRGLFALAVMVYHVLYVNKIAEVEVVAYYAVYGFFVISGFALYITYAHELNVWRYLVKRFFRIAPLWWLVLIATYYIKGYPAHWPTSIVWNATLTFGFTNPGATSLVGGGWSIGIEIIFYLLFPMLLAWPGLATLVFVPLMIYWDNSVLSMHKTMLEPGAWAKYIQPIAFLGYFASGMAIGKLYTWAPELKGYGTPVAILSLIPFMSTTASYPVELLVGMNGLILALATIALVTGFILMPEPKTWMARWLGDISYAVYLIHPLLLWLPPWQAIGAALGSATIVYYAYERPLRRLGHAIV